MRILILDKVVDLVASFHLEAGTSVKINCKVPRKPRKENFILSVLDNILHFSMKFISANSEIVFIVNSEKIVIACIVYFISD